MKGSKGGGRGNKKKDQEKSGQEGEGELKAQRPICEILCERSSLSSCLTAGIRREKDQGKRSLEVMESGLKKVTSGEAS